MRMVNELSLLPQNRFSKYATGINALYFPSRGIYNFSTNYSEAKQMPENMKQSLEIIKRAIDLNRMEQ